MHLNKEKIFATLPLFVAMIGFVAFGFFHLSKFETTDEHFWKYDRIQKYYTGLHDGITKNDWKKTRINDKPGITVALLSGLGLPFAPDPQGHSNIAVEESTRYTDSDGNSVKLYDVSFTEQTERINFALRTPILLFNALILLPLLFYLLLKAFGIRIAQISILLIGLNPILIGISQIINPDAILWGTSAIALISFYAFLTHGQKKFVFICAVATGCALLSKYTANLLFVFYPIIFVLHTFYSEKIISFLSYVKAIATIAFSSWLLYALFLPATIQNPAHFLYGTIYSPVLSVLANPFISLSHSHDLFFTAKDDFRTIPLFLLSMIVFGILTIILPFIGAWLTTRFKKTTHIILKTILVLYIAIISISLINAWTRTPFFPLENIKESSQQLEKLSFPQLAQYSEPLHTLFAIAIQMQNVIFSLHPLVLLLSICTAVFLLWNKKIPHQPMVYFPFIATIIFVGGGILSDIFVNVRYGLMLYVPYAVLAAIILTHMLHDVLPQKFHNKKEFPILLAIIIIMQSIALFGSAPYLFNYESILLPKKYTVTDSWGYGVYEAAMYLNTLPNARDLIVWSDHDGLCEFFIGKCISPITIDLDHTDIGYFVFTRRGVIHKPFLITTTDSQKKVDRDFYYSAETFAHPAWRLNINDRPDNYIIIIPFAKK
ncbi:MAG: glycosyltransferase family 39 protein [Parcubacteria group bacterium]|jgi:4-amino-4-deoxy-L-arabinose transferase-like glycosyltransferase